MSTVQRVTFASILADPGFPALVAGYATHAADELLGMAPNLAHYAILDHVPGCTAWEVRYSGELTGFAVLCIAPRPHSSALAATVESIYARVGGLQLRRALEQYAAEQGANVLLMSAPAGSRASEALVKSGMRICSSIHIKAL